MCMLNFPPYDSEGPDYTLPRGRPRLAWVVPVNMGELGASLQAIADTMPQTTTLRLCHRFRHGTLSQLSQEILEQVIREILRIAQAECKPGWYQGSVCWQGTCLPEDHYSVYNENMEKLWQEMSVDKCYSRTDEPKDENRHSTNEEKLDMIQSWIQGDREAYHGEQGWSLHFDALFRWVDRTCLCPESYSTANRQLYMFIPLQNVLKSQFGLEAIILHETLSPAMHAFLPNSHDLGDYAYYTACYLAFPKTKDDPDDTGDGKRALEYDLFGEYGTHTVFRETLDSSLLSISEKQRFRFSRAMKQLRISPCYHLSELEPHIIHPIEDETLVDICSCREMDCQEASVDVHSWDRPSILESILKNKSKNLARESWPKLMNLAASDTVSPCGWIE